MEEKKIVYVHTGVWPTPSPSIVFITGTAYGLSAHSSTALIVKSTPAPSGNDMAEPDSRINIREKTERDIFRSITGVDMPDRLEILRIGGGKDIPGNGAFFRRTYGQVGTWASEHRVRAVITRSIGFLPYLAWLRHRFRIPCFFETHDFFSDLSVRTDLKKTPGVIKKKMLERLFLPRLDGIICLTGVQAEFYRTLYPSVPVTIAPTGLIGTVPPGGVPDKKVCYIGSLDTHKGVGTLLAALARTADTGIKLLIIGGKNDREKHEFRKLVHLLNLNDRVTIISWIHHRDIGSLIKTCMAGVVPLADTPFNRFFTSPLKILDYLSRGIAVIASDLPSVRAYIEDGRHGILVEPGNVDSLAQALDRFCAGNLRETMAPEVLKHAERFLWTTRGARIMDFIRNCEEGVSHEHPPGGRRSGPRT